MSGEDELLDELVFQVLERREQGSASALDELCDAHPQLASGLRARVASLESVGLFGGGDELPDRLGEFEILRRLGEGGMGVVLLARQPRLSRLVAVKIVRPEQLYFRGARERFQREVEAIARLSHPSIIQVYTVGDEAGAPYYAMELAPGASLAEVLQRLRGRDAAHLSGADLRSAVLAIARERGFEELESERTEPLFAGTWADACLWLAREVAQALEHAHQRGVLHRDVKPSNILLTPGGRVLLTDFGLASTRGDERITGRGALIGSPAYMPPEQSSGESGDIGPRSDVYSLGVTLYESLALELPWERGSSSAGIDRRPIPLRRRRSGVPADFELACSTAFEADPDRRYASAAHFARDLTNLLQRRPIEARPIGALLAARRWSQRHPAAATALALALVAALTLPTVYASQEARASARIAVQRDVARGNLDAALDAIELLLEKVAHRDLRDVPRVDGLRRELLERATMLYERLEKTADGDLRTERRAAGALGRLARLRSETGDHLGALRDFDAAQARMQSIVDRSPDDPEAQFELGNLLAFATVKRFPAASERALGEMQAAVEHLRRAVQLDGGSLRPRHELARGLLGLAYFQDALDHADEAAASWSEALALAEPLAKADFDPRDGLELWVTALGHLGGVAQARGDDAEAERLYTQMLERSEDCADPSAFLRQMRALALQTLARMHAEPDGAPADPRVDDWIARSHAVFETLAREFPNNSSYSSSLALSWMDLGDRARQFGDLELAEERWSQARAVEERSCELAPNNPRPVRVLGLLLNRQSDCERGRQRFESAAELLQATLERFADADRLAGREFCHDDTLHALRALVEVGATIDDDELVARAGAQMLDHAHDAFHERFDSAVAYYLALLIAQQRGDAERESRWKAGVVEGFERALEASDAQPQLVVERLLGWQFEHDPQFAELYERASGR